MNPQCHLQLRLLSLITLSLLLWALPQRAKAQSHSASSSGMKSSGIAGASTVTAGGATGSAGVSTGNASATTGTAGTATAVSGDATTAGSTSEPVVINGVTAKEVSGVVRLIRANPETEVFFIDLKDSLIIPKDSQHNKLYDLCEQSRKKGTAVKLLIDPKSRRILGHPKPPENTDSAGSF